MRKGQIRQTDGNDYVVVLCRKTKSGNAAVLLRETSGAECITVSNLRTDGRGLFSWEFGYPSGSYQEAVSAFLTRANV